MKPAPFAYEAPTSIADAARSLASYDGEGRLLAGGQSLIAMLNFRVVRPIALIDLGKCATLNHIKRENGWLAIGAMTRQSAAESSSLVQSDCPLLAKALPYVGHPAIRNRGTIGGTMAHADRIAELPAVALALDAEFFSESVRGRRVIPARDFFVDDLTTALKADEILCEVRFPIAAKDSRNAFVEVGNRHHDLALVGVAAALTIDAEGNCTSVRLAAMGVGSVPFRLKASENELRDRVPNDQTIAAAAKAALADTSPESDVYASSEYRRRVLVGLVERALRQALVRNLS